MCLFVILLGICTLFCPDIPPCQTKYFLYNDDRVLALMSRMQNVRVCASETLIGGPVSRQSSGRVRGLVCAELRAPAQAEFAIRVRGQKGQVKLLARRD